MTQNRPQHESASPTSPTSAFVTVADWLTEELAQELYAARQDLADAAIDLPGCADEADGLRDVLLIIIRRLHEVALVLRDHGPGTMPIERIEELTDRIARDCHAAEASMARGRSVLDRHAATLRERSLRTGASATSERRLVALQCGPPVLRPRDSRSARRLRRAC